MFEFQKENRKKIIEISNLKTYNSELYIFFILFYFLIIYLYLYIYKENDRSVFCLFNETYFGYFPLWCFFCDKNLKISYLRELS